LARTEEGHCDPLDCWGDFISLDPSFKDTPSSTPYSATVVGCDPKFGIPVESVPIKTLLDGAMISPWVWLMFDGSAVGPSVTCSKTDWTDTIITTGNISQPGNEEKCRAVIKSFQYGWGAQQSGNVCKVQILDEKGSDFEKWVRRLIRNPQSGSNSTCQGVYKMRVRWGWMIAGNSGSECPASIPSVTPLPTCIAGVDHTDGTPWSNNPKQIICSPDMWFIPDEINCNYQNNKFIFEITGKDPMFRAGERAMDKTYPEAVQANVPADQVKKIHFTEAVRWLSYDSTPKFNVSFLSLPELPTGTVAKPQQMKFFSPSNVANIKHYHLVIPAPTSRGNCILDTTEVAAAVDVAEAKTDFEEKGPLDVWQCHNLPPIGVINSWLSTRAVLAKSIVADGSQGPQGIGITINYDSTYDLKTGTAYYDSGGTGQVDPNAISYLDCGWPAKGRLILWSNAIPICFSSNEFFSDRLKACYIVNGGKCTSVLSFSPSIKWNWHAALTQGGAMTPVSGAPASANAQPTVFGCRLPPGFGGRNEGVPNPALAEGGPGAGGAALGAHAQHARANMLHNAIEAELRVQGDPSDWLCSPLEGYGRTVAIVVVNPFFLERGDNDDCASWTQSGATRCNNVLTNRNWFIKAVEHQIKEGSYVTTLKVILLPFMGDAQAAGSPLTAMGLDPRLSGQTWTCEQATLSCKDRLESPDDVVPGTQEYCDNPCSIDYQVT
jgi:hypothetical protein